MLGGNSDSTKEMSYFIACYLPRYQSTSESPEMIKSILILLQER